MREGCLPHEMQSAARRAREPTSTPFADEGRDRIPHPDQRNIADWLDPLLLTDQRAVWMAVYRRHVC